MLTCTRTRIAVIAPVGAEGRERGRGAVCTAMHHCSGAGPAPRPLRARQLAHHRRAAREAQGEEAIRPPARRARRLPRLFLLRCALGRKRQGACASCSNVCPLQALQRTRYDD